MHRTRGYTIALCAAAVLSTTAIFIRYLTQTYHLPALVLALWRDGFVALTLLFVLGLGVPGRLRVARADLAYLAVYGLVLAVFNGVWTLSVAVNGAALATVLVYCSAAFTAVLGWWLLREHLGWVKIMAVAITLTGTVLISGVLDPAVRHTKVLGIATGILSGLGYAAYSLMGRSASQRGLNPWTTLFYTFGFAAVFLLLPNVMPGGLLPGSAARPADLLWLGRAGAAWGLLFLLAAGPTVAGFGLYNVSLTYLPSSVANLVVTLEPVFTALIAYLVLGERLTEIQVAGSLTILAGVVFLRIFEGRPGRP